MRDCDCLYVFLLRAKKMRKLAKNHQLFFLFLLFVIPMITSLLLYRYHDYFHLKTNNHGVLFSKAFDATSLYAGQSDAAQKKWRIIFVASNYCDPPCEQMTHTLHQVQKALGKDSLRVLTLALSSRLAAVTQLQQRITQQEQHVFSAANKVYLVDPLGNAFMYYPTTVDPLMILKDLKKVLEVSQIG